MRPRIHVNDPEGMRTADVEDVRSLQVGHLDELDAIGSLKLACDTRSVAARMRFQLVNLAVVIQRLSPRLKRNRLDRR